MVALWLTFGSIKRHDSSSKLINSYKIGIPSGAKWGIFPVHSNLVYFNEIDDKMSHLLIYSLV